MLLGAPADALQDGPLDRHRPGGSRQVGLPPALPPSAVGSGAPANGRAPSRTPLLSSRKGPQKPPGRRADPSSSAGRGRSVGLRRGYPPGQASSGWPDGLHPGRATDLVLRATKHTARAVGRHSASSIAFLSRMGASTGGIAVGSPHNSVQLHTSVWEKSPPLRRGSSDSSKQRLQGLCSTTGTFLPPTERSDRGSLSRTSNEGSSAATSSFQRGTADWGPFWIYGVRIFPFTKGSSRCWRRKPSCLGSKKGTGLSLST